MQNSGRIPSNYKSLFSGTIGRSVEGREILLFGTGEPHGEPGGTLLIGGMHGDEHGTVLVLDSFLEHYLRSGAIGGNVKVIPLANPDGLELNTRYNARGVDLNRNFETNWSPASEEPSGSIAWSEPESRALRDLILQTRPARIVSLHWALAELDADGPQSTLLARAMWNALDEKERAPYRVRVWEDAPGRGYSSQECPGSLGQWCGYGVRYPDGTAPAMVTLELPYDPHLPRPDELPADHLDTLRATWAEGASAYMAAIETPIHKMLAAACQEG